MSYESLLELAKKRRSIRRFKPEPIPDECVDKIIEVARWAPSGANSQPWEFIVVKKPELRNSIAQLLREQRVLYQKMELTREPEMRLATVASPPERPGYEDAPVFIILCGDPRTKDAYPLNVVIEHGDSVFDSSLASAFLYMALAVTTLGLGSQWVSATALPFAQCLIKELLGIPPELQIYDMLVVGYPVSEPRARLVRAKEEMVHYDCYDKTKFRTEAQVKNFITTLRRG